MDTEYTSQQKCELAIQKTGFGLYHYVAIGMCCACSFSSATAIMSVPFAIPIMACDMEVTQKTLVFIHVALSVGMAIGGFICGCFTDLLGRRVLITVSLLILFSSTFSCAFSCGPHMTLLCMFVLGAGVASNEASVKIYLAEILAADKRGLWLVFVDIFWTFGCLLLSTVGWAITPSIVHQQLRDMRLITWRLICGISSLFSITASCFTALLRPSPRFILVRQKYEETIDILKHMYALNTSRHAEGYAVRKEHLYGAVDDFHLSALPVAITCTEHVGFAIMRMKGLASHLLRRRFIINTILLGVLKIAVLLGNINTTIWLSKIMANRQEDCNITSMDILELESRDCKFLYSSRLYVSFFILTFNIFIGQLALCCSIDWVGRKLCLIASCIFCGIASFCLGYVNDYFTLQLLLSILYMIGFSVIDSTLNVVMVEVYPTAIRGTAFGSIQLPARFASALLKVYLQTPCSLSFILMGSIMLAASVLCYFLPELRRRPMVE